MIKKVCMLLGILLFVGYLTGYISGKGEGARTALSTAEYPGGERSFEKPYEGTVLRVLGMTGQISDSIVRYLDDFENDTGITVKMELYEESQLRERCITEFWADSSTIDVFLISPLQDLAVYSKNGWIEPLDEYLQDPGFDWDDFTEVPMEHIKTEPSGAIGTLPLYASVQLMYYRKDIFEQYDLTPPATYQELIDVCKRLHKPENGFYGIACRGEKETLIAEFSPFLYGCGGSFFEDGRCAFRNRENLEAVKFYGKLLGNYAPAGILTAGYAQVARYFNNGNIGICIDTAALYKELTDPEASPDYFNKVGVTLIPEGPQGRHSYKRVAWGASIYSGSANKDAAWEFLKFAGGKKIAANITPQGMPTFRASVWQDQQVLDKMAQEYLEAYWTAVRSETGNEYGLPRMTAVSEAVAYLSEAVMYSIETGGEGADLEPMLNDISERIDQLLVQTDGYSAEKE